MNASRALSILLFVVAGITVPGVLNFLFTKAGLPQLGTLAWIVGYGVVVLLAWVIWIRPINFDPEGTI